MRASRHFNVHSSLTGVNYADLPKLSSCVDVAICKIKFLSLKMNVFLVKAKYFFELDYISAIIPTFFALIYIHISYLSSTKYSLFEDWYCRFNVYCINFFTICIQHLNIILFITKIALVVMFSKIYQLIFCENCPSRAGLI